MRYILLLTLTLSIFSYQNQVHAEGEASADLTQLQKDQQNVAAQIQLISADLKVTSNLDKAVGAVNALEVMPYRDIPDLLIQLTIQELTKGRQKKRIIQALLVAIRTRATAEHSVPVEPGEIPPLVTLETKLLELVNSNDFKTHKSTFVNAIKEAMAESKQRPQSTQDKLFLGMEPTPDNVRENFNYTFVKKDPITNQVRAMPSDEAIVAKKYVRFKDSLAKLNPNLFKERFKEIKAGRSSAAELVYAGTARFISDDIADKIVSGSNFKILNRDDVAERVLSILARYKQQNAILIGSRGSGKTSIADRIAEMIVLNQVSQNEVTDFLSDAVMIQTSAGKISGLALTDKPAGQIQAAEEYFRGLTEVQLKMNRRIIVFIDEIHILTSGQVEAIKPVLDSADGKILLVGASTSPEWRAAFKFNEAFLRRAQDVPVREFSESEILEIFLNSWLPTLKKQHGDVIIDEKAIRLIIRKASVVYPDKGITDGAFVLADDIAIALRMRKNDKSKPVVITTQEVYSFIKREVGLPVDPTNFAELETYRSELAEYLRSEVIDQTRMIDDVVNLWMEVLRNESERGLRVGMVLGRSGTGKSELASQLAFRALGSKERVFTIDGNEYKDANDIKLSILFGVPGGVSFGEYSSGTLMEWLDDPAKGKHAGIIVINEGDKANLLFWTRLMEFFDRGSIQGGDNKIRKANKHLILITSNRGDKELFSDSAETLAEDQIRARVNEISEEEIKRIVEDKLSVNDVNNLPDSIVNRIDVFTVSNLITPRVAKIIAGKIISVIKAEYLRNNDIELTVDPKIVDEFVKAYDPLRRGARPLVRALYKFLNVGTTRALGSTSYKEGDTVNVKMAGQSSEGFQQIAFQLNDFKYNARAPIIDKKSTSVKEGIPSLPPMVGLACKNFFH